MGIEGAVFAYDAKTLRTVAQHFTFSLSNILLTLSQTMHPFVQVWTYSVRSEPHGARTSISQL